ncbi:MAG: type II toxin-antitoxin system PemK/MazF family toxin [Streptosporangiaceae bacterium]
MIPRTLPPRAPWPPRWTPSVRGDLYRLKAPRDTRGHEQAGERYAVVVQSDDLPLSTWIIAPTSTDRRAASFRPEIEINGIRTRVMVEQLTVIDPQTRLGDFAGRLDSSEMQAVNTALQSVLALD